MQGRRAQLGMQSSEMRYIFNKNNHLEHDAEQMDENNPWLQLQTKNKLHRYVMQQNYGSALTASSTWCIITHL